MGIGGAWLFAIAAMRTNTQVMSGSIHCALLAICWAIAFIHMLESDHSSKFSAMIESSRPAATRFVMFYVISWWEDFWTPPSVSLYPSRYIFMRVFRTLIQIKMLFAAQTSHWTSALRSARRSAFEVSTECTVVYSSKPLQSVLLLQTHRFPSACMPSSPKNVS